jgi:hypothetical protein
MGRRSPAESSAVELSRALARVAGDPRLTRHLHGAFGGFCHEFRNLLNSLRLSLYLARKTAGDASADVFSRVDRRYAVVERFIDRFHQVCRPMPLALVRVPLATLFDDRHAAWSDVLRRRGRRLVLSPPRDAKPAAFDAMRLASGLDDLVAWRALVGDPSTDLRVTWSTNVQNVITWDEPPAHRPASRVDADADDPSWTDAGATDDGPQVLEALTVPVLSRVISSHGGALEHGTSRPWRLTLRWPLDATPEPHETLPCSPSSPSR